MSTPPIRILLVEDNPGDARLMREFLKDAGPQPFETSHVSRLSEAAEWMRGSGADVILLDLSLPDAHGMATVRQMLEAAPDAPIIVLTGLDDETTALSAVQTGAQDYLVKADVDPESLGRAIRYALERKRLEVERGELLKRERDARATAEAAVKARDEVLRVVSHDLGNSLSAVRVTTTVLLRTLGDDGAAGVRQGIVNIRHLAEQMQRLRQDLLDVAVIEAGELTIHPELITPSGLVADVVERYSTLAADKSVSLDAHVAPDLPEIDVDGARITQVLTNLLTNAVKFTPPGGAIELGAELGEKEVRFFAKDSGSGISEAHLERLFDRFWKVEQGNRQGTGLGLAIAKGIVAAHGGRIWAESTPGLGSIFYFTIPVQ